MSSDRSWLDFIPLGGADSVTGAGYLVRNKAKGGDCYLFDAGLASGRNNRMINRNLKKWVNKIKAVFVTHPHIDHTGRIPYLYRLGYRGPVYSTEQTRELSKELLPDSGKINEQEYKAFLEKNPFLSKKLIVKFGLDPLYRVEHANAVMKQFVDVERGEIVRVDENLDVCFYNAGHTPGSCSIMATFYNGEEKYRILFSGDIGQDNELLKKSRFSLKKDVDLVVMESTYADRIHGDKDEDWKVIWNAIGTALENGGNVIFPASSFGKTQGILYLLYKGMKEKHDRVSKVLNKVPIIVDSRMGAKITKEYVRFKKEFCPEVRRMLERKYDNPFNFSNLRLIFNGEDSEQITLHENNYVAFSGSGMCSAGRILFHLEKDLPNPNSAIIITGYQAKGTIGSQLVDGHKEVTINGKVVPVRANIVVVNAYSGHADQKGLIKWLSQVEKGYKLGLVHGEPDSQSKFKDKLVENRFMHRDDIICMKCGSIYHLYKGGYYATTVKTAEEKEKKPHSRTDNWRNIVELERVRDNIASTMEVPLENELENEADKILSSLEKRLNAEMARKHQKAKRRSVGKRRRYEKRG